MTSNDKSEPSLSDGREEFYKALRSRGIIATNVIKKITLESESEVIYRENDIFTALAILICKSTNNLIVTGEEGVGKTFFVRSLSRYFGRVRPQYHMAEISLSSFAFESKSIGEIKRLLADIVELSISHKVIVHFDGSAFFSNTTESRKVSKQMMDLLKVNLSDDFRCILSAPDYIYESLHFDLIFRRYFRAIRLLSLTHEQKKNVIYKCFGQPSAISEQILKTDCLHKRLNVILDEIDYIQSLEFIKEKVNFSGR
ncbi:AAA family ATPase [Cronobacter turicensis]|nr:AAA family ATPase [Cronobacter turicensis]ELZ8935167.1 AAA family ATPase [Cronobacter dublinensis]